MIPKLSSTAMFWIGVGAVIVRIAFIDVLPFFIGPYQNSGSPTIANLLFVLPIIASIASGVGYAFIAGAFIVRHFEAREKADEIRSVHFIGRSASKND